MAIQTHKHPVEATLADYINIFILILSTVHHIFTIISCSGAFKEINEALPHICQFYEGIQGVNEAVDIVKQDGHINNIPVVRISL